MAPETVMMDHFQDLSSYDEYVTEVRSGRLEWSPVHRSEKFWRENAAKLNDKNYELLRILITLLESTKEPLVLSVACFDLGKAANIVRLKFRQFIFRRVCEALSEGQACLGDLGRENYGDGTAIPR